MVAGYNNVLKLATSSMKFGENNDVNYSKPSKESTSISSRSTSTSSGPTSTSRGSTSTSSGPSSVSKGPKINKSEPVLFVVTLVGGSIISKFLILIRFLL